VSNVANVWSHLGIGPRRETGGLEGGVWERGLDGGDWPRSGRVLSTEIDFIFSCR
jgi:hypothetical protein